MDLLLEAARFVTYAAALQLFGVAVFQRWLAPGGLRTALEPRARPLAILAALVLPAAMLAWLAATAGGMGDGWSSAIDPKTLWLVLTATSFGKIWGPLLILAVLLAAIAFWRSHWTALAIGTTVALCGLGLVGHAAIASGMAGILNRISQALHLLSSAFWLGSLLPLLICLPFFRDPAHMAEADQTLRRFSGLGHFAVALLMLSGVANSWFILGGSGFDLTRPYEQLLALKVMIAIGMVCLAIGNRYVFVPRIPNGGPGLGELAQGTIAEIVFSAAILALVSVIGTMSPG
ncbi:MAG TPA: copper homeostasis membrane protein CopD [Devosia sp.]|nr:copper homeostasis membrane protein CopD [Devosia sp.]